MLKLMNWLFDSSTNWWGRCSQYFPLSPLVLRIRITNRCNLSCHYCYVGESLNKKAPDLLTIEEWQKVIHHLPRHTLVDITGGEPLLAPGFKTLLDDLLSAGLKVSLISNGTLYKEEIFSLMVEKKLMHFMLSLDGPREIHDAVRGDGTFEKTIKTLTRIQELKHSLKSQYPKIVAKVTVTENNLESIDKFCHELIHVYGLDGVTLNLLFQNSARDGFTEATDMESEKFHSGNVVTFTTERIPEFVNQIKKIRSQFGDRVQLRPDLSLSDLESYFSAPKKMMPHGCFKFNSIVTLYQDGTLTPCDLGLNVGNIRELNFNISQVFKEKQMKHFLSFMRKTASENLPGCGGCCLKKHERVL